MGGYDKPLEELRAAVSELEQAVDALGALAELRGQGDDAFPLVVAEGDQELAAAVEQELGARAAVTRAIERLP